MKKLILLSAIVFAMLHTGLLQAQNIFPSSGNAGVGTITPSANLQINPNQANALQIGPYGAAAGNTGQLRLLELAANGTNYVGFRSPDAIGLNNSVVWVLPNKDGNAGQFLSTDGGGNLSWKNSGGATKKLDNLADVAINLSLLPNANNMLDIGSSSLAWKNGYFAGNVGVGTGSPLFRLHASNNATQDPTAYIHNGFNSTGFNDGLYVQAGNNGGTGGSYIAAFLRPDGSTIGTISQNTATTVLYSTTSDKRLKTNIRETKFGIADVKKIQVRDYNYADNPDEQTGFIAQQLYEVFPDAVAVGGEDAKKRPWMVDYGRITPLLVKAIQELDVINAEKEAELNALEETMANQQKQIDELKSQMIQLQSGMIDGAAKISLETTHTTPLLGQNIPNPFDNSTVIPFRIPKGCISASIIITESTTGRITTVTPVNCDETYAVIEAGSLSPGNYLYTLYIDGNLFETRQMLLVR